MRTLSAAAHNAIKTRPGTRLARLKMIAFGVCYQKPLSSPAIEAAFAIIA